MTERDQYDGRILDDIYKPMIFEKESGNVEAAIAQRTQSFFARMKKEASINHLAQTAADAAEDEGDGWTQTIDIIPLGDAGKKPMRIVTELRYYKDTVIAAVIQDFRPDGSIAVAFSQHVLSADQHNAAYGELEQLDDIINRHIF